MNKNPAGETTFGLSSPDQKNEEVLKERRLAIS